MKKRRNRIGEFVCRCSAYKFPHRFGGGKCSGISIVRKHVNTNYYTDNTCKMCNLVQTDGQSCQVIEGIENIKECEVFNEFIRYNEIKFYK